MTMNPEEIEKLLKPSKEYLDKIAECDGRYRELVRLTEQTLEERNVLIAEAAIARVKHIDIGKVLGLSRQRTSDIIREIAHKVPKSKTEIEIALEEYSVALKAEFAAQAELDKSE